MRILLVDDNEVVGRTVTWALSQEGFETAFISLGRRVPGMIAHFKPDALVLDVNLPDLNGVLVARLVREDWPDLPIIFATGSIEPAELDLPARTEFLLKPYSIDALIDAIRHLTHRPRSSDL